jgi:GMP synthase (glutamine-hydrolysing)
MRMGVVEPLRELFKDEVRGSAVELGLDRGMVWRHPFPGPGPRRALPRRGHAERCDLLREADAIILEEIALIGLYRRCGRSSAVLLPVQTVGVMGDARTYENAWRSAR